MKRLMNSRTLCALTILGLLIMFNGYAEAVVPTKAKVFLGAGGDSFTVSNSTATVYGNSGIDSVTIADGVIGVSLDQNIERINFSLPSNNYAFKQTGNIINIYNVADTTTLPVNIPVQDDTDGTVLGFSDGTASAKLTAGVMTLGGATVSSVEATPLQPVLTPEQSIFSQPPSPAGGLRQSSWVYPEGTDVDVYAYDDFTLATTQSINEVSWRGGYIRNAPNGHVNGFTITFFASIAGGTQPLATNPQLEDTNPVYLAKYIVNGNGGETEAGVVGATTMYDYRFVLPTPFTAEAGTKYWVRIEASQAVSPDWGIAVGTGGDVRYYMFTAGFGIFRTGSGDTAFTLN